MPSVEYVRMSSPELMTAGVAKHISPQFVGTEQLEFRPGWAAEVSPDGLRTGMRRSPDAQSDSGSSAQLLWISTAARFSDSTSW